MVYYVYQLHYSLRGDNRVPCVQCNKDFWTVEGFIFENGLTSASSRTVVKAGAARGHRITQSTASRILKAISSGRPYTVKKFCSPKCSKRYHARIFNLKSKYRLSLSDYDALLKSQGGVCAICKKPPKKRRLAVDHNHRTGVVRGLLCYTCNYALGFWHDNATRFLQAAEYLQKP